MRTIVSRLRTEYPVKAYQWIAIWAVLTVMWAGGIAGVMVYVGDQGDDLRRAEQDRCEQRVEARHGSRARALANIHYVSSVLDRIDEAVGIPEPLRDELEQLEQQEIALVDEQLPVLTLGECLHPSETTPRPNITTEEP